MCVENAYAITLQLLSSVEALHELGYIHGDIKPENICLAEGKELQVFLIDFGLATPYIDSQNEHIRSTKQT